MERPLGLALLALLVLAGTAAGAIDPGAFFGSPAMRAYEHGRYGEALTGFQELLARHPDDPMVLRYLGLTYQHVGRHAEAAATLERAVALAPGDASLYFFLALSYLTLGEQARAVAAFRRSIELAPNSVHALAAERYLAATARAAVGEAPAVVRTPWSVLLTLGVEHDDNVPGVPASTAGTRESLRVFEYLRGDLVLLQRGRWDLRGEVATYQSQHLERDLNGFNVSAFDVALDLGQAPALGASPVQPALRGSLLAVLLDGDLFRLSPALAPSLSVGLAPGALTTVGYRVTLDEFEEHGHDPRIAVRDAVHQAAGATQYVFFARGRAYLWVGYEFQLNEAAGRGFDYRAHRGQAGLSAPLLLGLRLDLNGEYTREDYPGVRPRDRTSDRWGYGVALSRALWPGLTLRAGYSFLEEDSNLSEFDYKRRVFGLSLGYAF